MEYAEEKLKLMQSLVLKEKEKIEILADGVKDHVLRRLVLSAWVDNVPDFYVCKITEDAPLSKRAEQVSGYGAQGCSTFKAQTNNRPEREEKCLGYQKIGHLIQDCRYRKVTCFQCGKVTLVVCVRAK